MPAIKITKDMFEKLDYDDTKTAATSAITTVNVTAPTVMIVFNDSDLSAAAYHLTQSLLKPAGNAIVTVLVQEAVLQDFSAKVKQQLPTYEVALAGNAKLQETLKQLNAKTIQAAAATAQDPIIICDFTHEQLGVEATSAGIVTLHAFRTAKEAQALCPKMGVAFVNASIWCENHARAYELIGALSGTNFFINCFNVSLECLQAHIKAKSSFATMQQGYHYETMLSAAAGDGAQKSVVFPYGTIFAN